MQDEAAFLQVLQQSARAGARRRAVVLHTNSLPQALARPHHIRLAREAVLPLAGTDRAQMFELSRGRLAIVWRNGGDAELAQARTALGHLLAGQPDGTVPEIGGLLALYDLPHQADWLLDEISDAEPPAVAAPPLLRLDAARLAELEARLHQADLSRFSRWRPVLRLDRQAGPPAWEERYFAIPEIAAELCPDCDLKAEPWLFRRLTRILDRRMLAMLGSPRELRGCGAFAINLTVETILSAGFMAFDEALPVALRGEVLLYVGSADLLSDLDGFTFARRFAQARGYRLVLADASPALLRFLNLAEAGLDFVQLACSAELMAAAGQIRACVPDGTELVLKAIDTPEQAGWARRGGFRLGRGRGVA